MKKYITIHGHFYQPPRENPWTEEIEYQSSAAPFHDWNERIYHECYRPNTRARIFDKQGRITRVVNNFEKLSFNFGPTLITWLKAKHPLSWQKIVEADALSLKVTGHGNAMAQPYNHMILPLANREDKITQIRWGIKDFVHHFGRDPKGMWLPEAAINEETLEVLAEEGIGFVVLSPYQAAAMRPLGDGHWTDVSDGSVNPKRPYRCFLKKNPSAYVDVFFYDGPISKAAGFDDLLFDAKRFMDRLESAWDPGLGEAQLIHIATDGESFGHHKPFGDRALAYLLFEEAKKRGYEITHYAKFLAENPPAYEVRLKDGGESGGTSWSCAHGVGRWNADCGCQAGGQPGWNQAWRKPLRDALDWLRDEMIVMYESEGRKYFRDPWDARNDYIRVLLERGEKSRYVFFEKNAVRSLNPDEVVNALKLLEMERNAMLMYTSCAWFFSEISGIETVQVLLYAARAMQLCEEVSGHTFEALFLKKLEAAKSNLEIYGTGRGVYDKLVKSHVANLLHIVNHFAISALFEENVLIQPVRQIYFCRAEVLGFTKITVDGNTLALGRIKVQSDLTLHERDTFFCVIQSGLYHIQNYMRPYAHFKHPEIVEKELIECMRLGAWEELLVKIKKHFGDTDFSLKDLFFEDRVEIIRRLTQEAMERISVYYDNIYQTNRPIHKLYSQTYLEIPEEFLFAAHHALNKHFILQLSEMAKEGFVLKKHSVLFSLLEEAKAFGIDIKKAPQAQFLSVSLEGRIERLVHEHRPEILVECLNIFKVAEHLGVELDLRKSQDTWFFFVHDAPKSDDPGALKFLNSHEHQAGLLAKHLNLSP